MFRKGIKIAEKIASSQGLLFRPCEAGAGDIPVPAGSAGAFTLRENLAKHLADPIRVFVDGLTKLPLIGIATPEAVREGETPDHRYRYYLYDDGSYPEIISVRGSNIDPGAPRLNGIPALYAQLLACFEKIAFAWVARGEYFVELDCFREERDSIRETIVATKEALSEFPDEVERLADEERRLDSLLPIYADGVGNYFLVDPGNGAGELIFFDHECGYLIDTGKTFADFLSRFWSSPYTPRSWPWPDPNRSAPRREGRMKGLLLDALCTECSGTQEITVARDTEKIRCKFCSHEVPMMFGEKELAEMRATKRSKTKHMLISLVAFVLAAALFAVFYVYLEKHSQDVKGSYVFLAGAAVSMMLSIWQVALAANKKVAYCRF